LPIFHFGGLLNLRSIEADWEYCGPGVFVGLYKGRRLALPMLYFGFVGYSARIILPKDVLI
jgi:hypothetical protein